MIKQLAWNTFKNTGNIDTYLENKYFYHIAQSKEGLKGLKHVAMQQ